MQTRFANQKFDLLNGHGASVVSGFLSPQTLTGITDPANFVEGLNTFIKKHGYGSEASKLRKTLGKDLPNFLFIRSLLDYGSIGTSYSFEMHLLRIYQGKPELFDPSRNYWREIEKMNIEQASATVGAELLPLTGLFRTDFLKVVVPNWIHMIKFLHEKCKDDASNFFLAACKEFKINKNDPQALELFQSALMDRTIRQEHGIDFACGPKTSLLLLSFMTDSKRGFNVLKGAGAEQVKNLKAPIDSEVIRVLLNSGLAKIDYVHSDARLVRGDLTDVCQRGMALLAGCLGLSQIELDYFIWPVGSLVCKHRGKFCFLCPISEICESFKHGYVRESSGTEYQNRCFSFGRPQPQRNALFLRGCRNCPHRSRCRFDRSLRVGRPYADDSYKVRKKVLP